MVLQNEATGRVKRLAVPVIELVSRRELDPNISLLDVRYVHVSVALLGCRVDLEPECLGRTGLPYGYVGRSRLTRSSERRNPDDGAGPDLLLILDENLAVPVQNADFEGVVFISFVMESPVNRYVVGVLPSVVFGIPFPSSGSPSPGSSSS